MAIDISGMSTQQLIDMDINTFNSLTKTELSQVVSKIGATANKRIKSFQNANIQSPAYNAVNRGGKITAKGKSLNQLRSEYSRARTFLKSKTGTVSGYKKTRQSTRTALAQSGVSVSDEKMDEMLNVYEKLKDIDSSIADRRLKYKTMDEVGKMLDSGKNPDDITDFMINRINQLYEEMEETENDISEFFEI